MDLAEIRLDVRDRLGEDAPNFWSDAQIDRRINQAVIHFNHERRWPWLLVRISFSVTANSTEIQLVDDVDLSRQFNLAMKPATDTDDRRLYHLERVEPAKGLTLRQMYPWARIPMFYYLAHRAIDTYTQPNANTDATRAIAPVVRVIPAPWENYTAEFVYYRNTRTLTSATDVPDVPMQYHDAICSKAAADLWLKELAAPGKAGEAMALYGATLEQAIEDLGDLADDESLVYGGGEPLKQRVHPDAEVLRRLPLHLGP